MLLGVKSCCGWDDCPKCCHQPRRGVISKRGQGSCPLGGGGRSPLSGPAAGGVLWLWPWGLTCTEERGAPEGTGVRVEPMPHPGPPGSPWGVSAALHPDSRAGFSKYSPRLPLSPMGPAARCKAGSSVALTCCCGPLFRTHSPAWDGPPLWNAGQLDLCCSNTRHYSLQIWGESMTFCSWDHRKCLFMFSNRWRSAQDPGVPGRTGCVWPPFPPWLSCSMAQTGRPSRWGRAPSSGCSPGVSLDVLVNEGVELWQCPSFWRRCFRPHVKGWKRPNLPWQWY